jgi:hypothetical protein
VHERVNQVVAESRQRAFGREVFLFARPFGDRVDDAADELLDRAFALGDPTWPRKYFETTMLVACCDQDFGISTPRCSKTTVPFSLPMIASRVPSTIEWIDARGRRIAETRWEAEPCAAVVSADSLLPVDEVTVWPAR